MSRISRIATLVGAVMLLACLIGTVEASATEPWWHVAVSSRPMHLQTPRSPFVQEVTAGSLSLLEAQKKFVACVGSLAAVPVFEGGPTYCELLLGHPASTTAELQARLESLYGTVGFAEPASGQYVITTPTKVASLELGASFGGSVTSSGSGESGRLAVIVSDIGTASSRGTEAAPITVTDQLPVGVVALEAEAPVGESGILGSAGCAIESPHLVTCRFPHELPGFEAIEMEIVVAVDDSAPSEGELDGTVTVVGGGTQPVSVPQRLQLSKAAIPFGLEAYEFKPEAEGGAEVTQAGSHPFQLTTSLQFDAGAMVSAVPGKPIQREPGKFNVELEQPAQPRNLHFELPVGLIGNPSAVEQCSEAAFRSNSFYPACPNASVIGVATSTVVERANLKGLATLAAPVFNLAPQRGEPARFGFSVKGVPVVLDTKVTDGNQYRVDVDVHNLATDAQLLASTVTLWGEPNARSHDGSRGWSCVEPRQTEALFGPCRRPLGLEDKPFLRLPTSCGSALAFPVQGTAWESDVEPISDEYDTPLKVDGCSQEPFTPTVELAPGNQDAASPTSLTVHLKVPQKASEAPEGVSESDVKTTTVSLPEGLQINPAAAGGLASCGQGEFGVEKSVDGSLVYTEESEAERDGTATGLKFGSHRNGCPEQSELGTVKVKTPLLEEELEGAVYQAQQDANPFGSLLAVYVIAEAPKAGVRLRLAGEVKVQGDGQLVSTFPKTPQMPFEEFTLKFFGGGKAALATTGCGRYETTSSIEPWSDEADATPTSFFDVTEGPGGSSCSSLGAFAPAFTAGTTNPAGAAFTPFTMTLARKDGEKPLRTVAMTMPPGLAAMLSTVPLCGEAEASVGTCSQASKIGHVTIQAGVGKEPIELPETGKPQDPVYLTGPYDGAPFGLAIVVPAEAGPFNLDEGGRPVVVRAKIEVNPTTAQVTIVSDPMPAELQNIKLDVRSVQVTVDREGFMFNPTDCEAMSITGTIGSEEGASEAVSSRFEAADCASLPFKPDFKASTKAKHSRKKGAALRVVVQRKEGEANIRSVLVKLPKSLAARESTLKQACGEEQFAKDPAACPEGSKVGTATVNTPVLPVPLLGTAYYVSHGGAAYPDLDLVLQGDGVTIVLTGNTHVNGKTDVTSSDFKSTPDVPFSRFELTLPEQPNSAIGGNGNLCYRTVAKKERVRVRRHGKWVRRIETVRHKVRRHLKMPTTITGQNGAVIKQATKVAVTGCGKHKKAKGAGRHHAKGARRKR